MEPAFEGLRRYLHRYPGKLLGAADATLRESGVVVPLWMKDGEPHVLFTQRPATLKTHPGQISFPGGRRDEGDATLLHTALREMEEEIGLGAEDVEVVGMLDEVATFTGYRILPFVVVLQEFPRLRLSGEEVEFVIEAPLAGLSDPRRMRIEGGIYFYDYRGHVIWGATARILNNLLAIVSEIRRGLRR